jgi:hypothetical protein
LVVVKDRFRRSSAAAWWGKQPTGDDVGSVLVVVNAPDDEG